jgi:hypothetical protein
MEAIRLFKTTTCLALMPADLLVSLGRKECQRQRDRRKASGTCGCLKETSFIIVGWYCLALGSPCFNRRNVKARARKTKPTIIKETGF